MCSASQQEAWWERSSGPGSVALFQSRMSIARQPWLHLFSPFLPMALGSAQLILPAPIGMLTNLFGTLDEGHAAHTWFIPSPSFTPQWAPGCRAASESFLSSSSFSPFWFTPTYPPLSVSVCGSLRHVCALSKDSFVELLFKLWKLRGERSRVSLTPPLLWCPGTLHT